MKTINKHQGKRQRVLFLLVEGETEENYLFHLKRTLNHPFRIKIKTKSKLSMNIKNDLKRIMDQYGVSEDEIILIYDLENSPEEKRKFIKAGHLVHPHTYLSQSCIELHFLLHYADVLIDRNLAMSPQSILQWLKVKDKHYAKGYHYSWKKAKLGPKEIYAAAEKAIEMFSSYEDLSFSTLGFFIRDYL